MPRGLHIISNLMLDVSIRVCSGVCVLTCESNVRGKTATFT